MSRAAVCITLAAIAATGQGLVRWPEELIVSESPKRSDSASATAITSEQTVYLRSVRTDNRVAVTLLDSHAVARQQLSYTEERDAWLEARTSQSDLSGDVALRNVAFFDAIGVEWRPTLAYDHRQDQTIFQGLADIGPRIEASPFSIPLEVRGGVSALVWDDHVPGFDDIVQKRWRDTLGVYGGLEFGDASTALGPLPVRAHGSFYGRAVEGASQITGAGEMLYRAEMARGDSLYVHIIDTVSNGNNAFVGGARGAGYINTPRVFANSFAAIAALKGIARLGIEPMLYYRFAHATLEYPDSLVLNNAVNTRHAAAVLGQGSLWGIAYEGGLAIEFEQDNKLPALSLSATSGRDTLSVDTRDFEGFRPETRHRFMRYWDNGMGATYEFSINRYLREYPRLYVVDGADTIRSDDDYDEIVRTHQLEATVTPFEPFRLKLLGGFTRNLRYRLKPRRSADSYVDRTYMVGMHATIKPHEDVVIEERLTGRAEVMEFTFGLRNGAYPPYSRSIGSDARLRWRLSDMWNVSGQWDWSRWDYGYWDSPRYRDTTIDTTGRDSYYAIQHKSTDQKIILATELSPGRGMLVRGGVEFRDVYFLEYKNGGYVTNDLGTGYVAAPFLQMDARLGGAGPARRGVTVRGRIRRIMDTIADDYWDMHVTLEALL
jgi:hypothetical protein